MGNLHSVSKAIERLGYTARITAHNEEILAAEGAVLPGVGAFGDAMEQLMATRLAITVQQFAASGKPLLGICLGMQLLFTASEEFGHHAGLALLSGKVVRFQGDFKIPHIGWNRLSFTQRSPLLHSIPEGCVYFVHSYHVLTEHPDDLLATTDYGGSVSAIVGRGNLFGMQFHPEKSGAIGMSLLNNFLKLTQLEDRF